MDAVEFPSVVYREGPEAVARLAGAMDEIDFEGEFYRVEAMAMEPKPPRGADIPVWIGGHSEAAFRRAGRFGDVALNLTGLFLAGARSVDAMIDVAGALHGKLRAELG